MRCTVPTDRALGRSPAMKPPFHLGNLMARPLDTHTPARPALKRPPPSAASRVHGPGASSAPSRSAGCRAPRPRSRASPCWTGEPSPAGDYLVAEVGGDGCRRPAAVRRRPRPRTPRPRRTGRDAPGSSSRTAGPGKAPTRLPATARQRGRRRELSIRCRRPARPARAGRRIRSPAMLSELLGFMSGDSSSAHRLRLRGVTRAGASRSQAARWRSSRRWWARGAGRGAVS